jgi:hypothetical protein
MCYEKKLDVSKTEVHSIALVQSIYNNIRSNLFVMLRICGEIDLNILLYGNTGISVGYFWSTDRTRSNRPKTVDGQQIVDSMIFRFFLFLFPIHLYREKIIRYNKETLYLLVKGRNATKKS